MQRDNIKKGLQFFPKIAFILGCISFIVLFIGQIGDSFGGKSDPNVKLVLQSMRENYGMITYEDAFEAFFNKPKWESFTSKDGDTIVEFSGEARDDISVTAQFTLYVEAEYFELSYLEYNRIPQSLFERASFLDTVFDSYLYN